MAETKALLKEARDAIQGKDFQNALNLCQKVLELSNYKNYMAFVFGGLCQFELENIDEALNYYTKGTLLHKDKILAWQGIYNVYTKTGQTGDEAFVGCLKKLISFNKEPEKLLEYQCHLCECLMSTACVEEAVVKLGQLRKSSSDPTETTKICELITRLLSPIETLSSDAISLLNDAFETLINDHTWIGEQKSTFFDSYLVFTERFCDEETVKQKCKTVLETFKGHEYAIDLLSRSVLINLLVSGDKTDLSLLPEKDFSELAELVYNSQWDDALQSIRGFDRTVTDDPLIQCLSTVIHTAVGDFKLAVETGMMFVKSSEKWKNNTSIKYRILESVGKSYLAMENKASLEKAQSIATDALTSPHQLNRKVFTTISLYALAALDDIPSAWERLFELEKLRGKDSDYFGCLAWVQMLENRIKEAKESAMEALSLDGESSWNHFLLGKVLWESGEREGNVLKEFLLSGRLNPYHAPSFLYLGRCYEGMAGKDTKKAEKAIRCLERAWELNNYSVDIARTLSDAYTRVENRTDQMQLLRRVVDSFPPENVSWAWLRLSLEQMHNGDTEMAIATLHKTSTSNPSDGKVWECLGDAYLNRGSQESALKSYKKVLELEPENVYVKLRKAQIYLDMGLFLDTISACTSLLSSTVSSQKNGPAYLLTGQAYYGLYGLYSAESRFIRSFDCLRDALKWLTLGCKKGIATFSLSWKTMGDTYLKLSDFPLELITKFEIADVDENKLETKAALLQASVQCYVKAVRLQPGLSSLWHGLGICLMKQGEGRGSRALAAFQRAIQLNPGSSEVWVSMGVLYATSLSNPSLAQHCFVRALQLHPHDAGAWSSLGLLYFLNENKDLAHRAFKMAQSSDPNFPNSWCLQACIAQMIGHDDAMDLFRHTVTLGCQPIAAAWYADLVLREIGKKSEEEKDEHYEYSINYLHAVRVAADALMQCCDTNRNCPEYYSLLGALLHLDGMHDTAEKFCTLGLSTVEKQSNSSPQNVMNILQRIRVNNFGDIDKYLQKIPDNSFTGVVQKIRNLAVGKVASSSDSSSDCDHIVPKIVNFVDKLLQKDVEESEVREILKTAMDSHDFEPTCSWILRLLLLYYQNIPKIGAWVVHQFPYLKDAWNLINNEPTPFSGSQCQQLTTTMQILKAKQRGKHLAIFLHQYAGRLYQVEYAMEAIGHAGTCLGMMASDGILLAAEKRNVHKLLDEEVFAEKIYRLNENMACSVAGITSDANVLINYLRVNCQKYQLNYGEPIPCEQLVQWICDLKQAYTQVGGKRPFGVSLLYMGWDKHFGFQLYQSDPSGNYGGWKATCIGNNNQAAINLLKQDYKSPNIEEAKALCMKVLSKTLDVKLSAEKIELALMTRKDDKTVMEILPKEELERLVNAHLEKEKEKEEQAAAASATR